ncbi:hypothetical protein LINGRAHAP2_LOCUS12961 [Linum grandiflorum]
MQFTRIPCGPISTARFFTSPTTACFDAVYTCGACPCTPAVTTLAVNRMDPRFRGTITLAACFAARKAPYTLTPKTASKVARSNDEIVGYGVSIRPALLNMMSNLPWVETAVSTAFSTWDSSVTSQWTYEMSSFSITVEGLTSATMTFAPCLAKRAAVAAPMPLAPPVMMATLSCNLLEMAWWRVEVMVVEPFMI